jgi:hypothetical protein
VICGLPSCRSFASISYSTATGGAHNSAAGQCGSLALGACLLRWCMRACVCCVCFCVRAFAQVCLFGRVCRCVCVCFVSFLSCARMVEDGHSCV